MTSYPWRDLKLLETQNIDLAVKGDSPSPEAILKFRRLIKACEASPDSSEAICFHGCSALLAQFEGEVQLALHHRRIEAKMIKRLYKLETENPTDGWTLQNYGDGDIEKRDAIVLRLQTEST